MCTCKVDQGVCVAFQAQSVCHVITVYTHDSNSWILGLKLMFGEDGGEVSIETCVRITYNNNCYEREREREL